MANKHFEEIVQNLIQKRLVYVENEKIYSWINHFKAQSDDQISDEKIDYEDCRTDLENAPQSTQGQQE